MTSAADVPAAVSAALAAFGAGRAALAQGIEVEPLTGGMTNRSWRVRTPDVDWVVRAGTGHDAALAIDRGAELVALAAASRAGLAPTVVQADAAAGTCVLRYVPGHAWSRDEARAAAGLARLGARVRELHALPLPAALPALDVAAAISHHLDRTPDVAGPIPRAQLAARARAALAAYVPAGRAFCHHDLHHLNVIGGGGRLTFLDWEYAAVGDPALDLAAWASYHDLDAPARGALREAYGTTGPVSAAALERACAVFDCLEALWHDAAGTWSRVEPAHRSALIGRLTAGGR